MSRKRYDVRFSRGLRMVMARDFLTVEQLRDLTGVTAKTISDIRIEKSRPHRSTMELLAAAFDMTVEEVEALGTTPKSPKAPP